MKILYGVSGEGLGHSTHALKIASHLEEKGHEVLILTYGRATNILKEKFKTVETYGSIIVCDNRIKPLKTINHNIIKFIRERKKILNAMKQSIKFNPDICISDMEATSSLYARFHGLPLIAISNQSRFTRFKLSESPRSPKGKFMTKNVIRSTMPLPNYSIALSISELEPRGRGKRSFISSPVIKKEIENLKPVYSGDIVVYLSKKDEKILNVLKKRKEKFLIYGFDKKLTDGNLEYKTSESFLKDFEKCKAIISNGGFTSVGEAIYLQKPYLAIPIIDQFEQEFNSLFIKNSGIGYCSKNLDNQTIDIFLKNINEYKKNLKKYKLPTKDPTEILDEILDLYPRKTILEKILPRFSVSHSYPISRIFQILDPRTHGF